jgi:hypothetical protein
MTTAMPPSTFNDRVTLQPVTENDYEALRSLELSSTMLHHWRFGGATPSPEVYEKILWQGVYAQYLIIDNRVGFDRTLLGLIFSYDVDLVNGTGKLGAAKFATSRVGGVLFLEGFGLFVDLTFALAPLRKLYLEVPEHNLASSGRRSAGC